MAEKALTRSEWLVALMLFLLPLPIPLFSYLASSGMMIPQWLDSFFLVLFLGGLVFSLALALFKGLPRWSPPYLGFLLMLGLIIAHSDRIWDWIYPCFVQLFGPRSSWSLPVRIWYVGVFEGIILSSILLGALLVVNLLRLLPYFRGVWQRMRADWTILSYAIYGALVLGIAVSFDEYHYDQAWMFISWIFLAVGAWLYLKARNQIQRIVALIGGATGAMWTVVLAKWVLIPLQKWLAGYPISPSETTRWVETGSAVTGWSLVMIMLLMPVLLDLLPESPTRKAWEAGNLG